MRNKLIYELLSDLHGPRNFNFDLEQRCKEVLTNNPLTEYIVGVLEPYQNKEEEEKKIDEEYEEGVISFDDPDDTGYSMEEGEFFGKPPTELEPDKPSSSFGLSFNVNKEFPKLSLCITWARYKEKNNNFYREPFGYIFNLDIKNTKLQSKSLFRTDSNGSIDIYYKNSYDNITKTYVVSIFFVNNLKFLSKNKNIKVNNSIFQPQIRVKCRNDTEIIQMNKKEEDYLSILYSNSPVLGRGFSSSVIWKSIDYLNPNSNSNLNPKILWADGFFLNLKEEKKDFLSFLNCDIRSEFLPIIPIVRPEFIRSCFDSMDFSPLTLSELWDEDEFDILLKIPNEYEKWILKNEELISKNKNKNNKKLLELIKKQRIALKRIRKGIKLLKEKENIRLAFCFANRAIYLSNKWKKNQNFSWYPFQLAFILLNIESIYDKESKYREYVDLLWIPTGGGKTEAYLAIIALNIAYRRIHENFSDSLKPKKLFSNRNTGISVITRYTLRLLTIQQFRRALSLIVAADYLRIQNIDNKIGWRPKKCPTDSNYLFGATRISIGLWVGSKVTPSHLNNDYAPAIKKLSNPSYNISGEPAQVLKCPACQNNWLSIPKRGLSKSEQHSIFWIFSHNSTKKHIKAIIQALNFSKLKLEISFKLIFHPNHEEYFSFKVNLKSKYLITDSEIEDIFKILKNHFKENNINLILQSLHFLRPGYFGITNLAGSTKKDKAYDFEVYCSNPNCPLSNISKYIDGVPKGKLKIAGYKDLYHNSRRAIPEKFDYMPISAYTVDDQIYGKCPTLIISTADKYARLAYEPRCASIFGNVDKYNEFFGYLRNNLYPKIKLMTPKKEKYEIKVHEFSPPDLIIQDELHLMEGPLGSMFGLYEITIDALIKQAKGNPKYIASTATIKNAEQQIRLIFAKKVIQFPPFGISIDDSFYVKEDKSKLWKKEQPGRLYMGVFVPGKGPQLPNLRIWASLLQKVEEIRINDQSLKEIRNFWTIVGYFNALHVLGNARAIIRDDVIDRLKQLDENRYRQLRESHIRELSSQIDSTDIAEIIKELEDGGLESRNIKDNPDIILSTSMFGTGVDIGHLSLMTVQGQPKSTSQYIQATGRVGRSHGGLIILQFKASRPRDISHFEMFSSYHSRIYLEVEPISVSPFSQNAMIKAAGPILVAFLRNMRNSKFDWKSETSPSNFLENGNNQDISKFFKFLQERLNKINMIVLDSTVILNQEDIISFFKDEIRRWNNLSIKICGNNKSLYFSQFIPSKKSKKHKKIIPVDIVLGDPLHEELKNVKVVYSNAPQSLREVDENIGFRSGY